MKQPTTNPQNVQKATIPNGLKFLFGGLAGICGTCVVHPLDLVKTRMQVAKYNNTFHCISTVIKNEGFFGLYSGLSASILRQATYTTARLGTYVWMVDLYRDNIAPEPTIIASMGMGIVAGAIGAFVGNPADLALIRMAADGRLPLDERRNYKNVIDALLRIMREEGVFTLWRGSVPTVARAMVVNMCQLASYSQFKLFFKKKFQMKEGLPLVFCASMGSGLVTTLASMPVDIVKTRIQNQKTKEYTGTVDALVKIIKKEGIFALWKGFTPYYCRLGPLTVLIFVFLEQFNRMYFKYVLKDEEGGRSL